MVRKSLASLVLLNLFGSLPLALAADPRGNHAFPAALVQEAYLKASNTGTNDYFGFAVAVSGDTVVIGAPQESSNGSPNDRSLANSGAAYVFTRAGSTWTQQAFLKAFNRGGEDKFGSAVAIAGDLIVIGAPFEDSNGTGIATFVDGVNNDSVDSGAAYVYARTGTNWILEAYLKASNTGSLDHFGESVGVYGNTVVIGASGEDSSATGVNNSGTEGNGFGNSGAAYVFTRSGNIWSQQAYLKASPSRQKVNYNFGRAVAISQNIIVVGAPGESSRAQGINGDENDDNLGGAAESGAAYIFTYRDGIWSQDSYLKASNTRAGAHFGFSVSVSTKTVVVGSPNESARAHGVNDYSDQNDTSTVNSGAGYVFSRDATGWFQQAYLKASVTDSSDAFAGSVSISDGTIVVGSNGEDSDATGVNGDEENSRGNNSGAVYVFIYEGTNWTQQAYLKASNNLPLGLGAINDFFGTSVSVSEGTVVSGAPAEDSKLTGVNPEETDPPLEFNIDSGAAYVFRGFGPTFTPEIVLEQPAGTSLNAGITTVDFGNAAFRAVPALTFVIKNIGNAPLHVTNITLTGPNGDDFSIIGNALSSVLNPGVSQSFNLQFHPGPAIGPRSALLQVHSNDADESSFDIALAGFALPPPEGLTLVADPLSYPVSGGNILVDDLATLRTSNTVNWATVTLDVSLQNFGPPTDHLSLLDQGNGTNRIHPGPTGTIDYGGTEIAALSTNASTGHLLITFNTNATTQAIEALIRDITYTNASFADSVKSNNLARFEDRTVTFQLRDAADERGHGSRVIRFPYLVALESPPTAFIVRSDPTYHVELMGLFSDGSRQVLSATGINIAICSDILDFGGNDPLGFRAKHVGVGGGVCHVEFLIGDLITTTTFFVKDECFVTWIFDLVRNFPAAGRLYQRSLAPASPSLQILYGLEALLDHATAGQRLTALYWRHTQELVEIVSANPGLIPQMRQVFIDFEPAVIALLSGKGTTVQITQGMIDRLNSSWTTLANLGSSALLADMESERTRLNGFQPFVGKNFSEWAALLEVPAPAQPYVQIFNGTVVQGGFLVEANYVPGLDYSLWKNRDLTPANWEAVSDAATEINSVGIQLIDTNGLTSRIFYKVQARETAVQD